MDPLRSTPVDISETTGRALSDTRHASFSDEERQAAWADLKAMLEAYRSSPEYRPIAPGEAVARVRALRDEWD